MSQAKREYVIFSEGLAMKPIFEAARVPIILPLMKDAFIVKSTPHRIRSVGGENVVFEPNDRAPD